METIKEIKEVKGVAASNGYSTQEGYEVITTKQTIRLLIDDGQNCCESWGYFFCNENPQDFVGANVLGVALTDTALNTKIITDHEANSRDEGGIMFVNIETDKGTLQFVVYNSHNGYYGHEAVVECEQLTERAFL